jgi:hypothetical protein
VKRPVLAGDDPGHVGVWKRRRGHARNITILYRDSFTVAT